MRSIDNWACGGSRGTYSKCILTCYFPFLRKCISKVDANCTHLLPRFNADLDVGAWYHESFVRGSPNQMQKMVRIKVKGVTACSEDRKEPNFYMSANNLQNVPSKNLRRNISYTEISLSSNEASVDQVISQALTIPKQIGMARSRRVSMDYAVPSSVSSACNHRFEEFPESQRVPSESYTSTADQPIDEFAQFIDAMIHVL